MREENKDNRKQTAADSGSSDPLVIGGHSFRSRFILGSGKYNVDLIRAAEILSRWR